MKLSVVLTPRAEADLEAARAWYDRQRPRLGDDLLECVQDSLRRIEMTPEIYGKVHRDIRVARVRRFPYLLVFRRDCGIGRVSHESGSARMAGSDQVDISPGETKREV